VHRHRLAATPDSTATVIHTSGTTGRPRGCVITHGNFIFETETMVGRWEPGFRSRLGSTGNAHRMVLVDGA
jgi:long-chain acyl-CoA synthetase